MTEWPVIFIFPSELSCITLLFPPLACNMFTIRKKLINDLLQMLIPWEYEPKPTNIRDTYKYLRAERDINEDTDLCSFSETTFCGLTREVQPRLWSHLLMVSAREFKGEGSKGWTYPKHHGQLWDKKYLPESSEGSCCPGRCSNTTDSFCRHFEGKATYKDTSSCCPMMLMIRWQSFHAKGK